MAGKTRGGEKKWGLVGKCGDVLFGQRMK